MERVRVEPDDESVSEAVVRAVADAEGVSPTDVTPPLYESVSPEALDDLFGARPGGHITFPYCGYEVSVRNVGDTTVLVRDRDETPAEFR